MMRLGITPKINALATSLIVFSIVLVVTAMLLIWRESRGSDELVE